MFDYNSIQTDFFSNPEWDVSCVSVYFIGLLFNQYMKIPLIPHTKWTYDI